MGFMSPGQSHVTEYHVTLLWYVLCIIINDSNNDHNHKNNHNNHNNNNNNNNQQQQWAWNVSADVFQAFGISVLILFTKSLF